MAVGFNIVNNAGIDLTQLIELAQELLSFSQEKVGWRRPPTLMLNSDPENAENPLGKTAHYNPETFEIVILIDKRHPKDILRSLSHELVHHFQNERGDFDRDFDTSLGYAQKDPHLRNMEAEAYETGNLCFRDWEDGKKELNESIYYTKPILGGEDMSNDTKKPLKEWKDAEINFRLMKKFGLLKETEVDGGAAEQVFHEETTDEKTNLEEDEDGGDDDDPESIKGAQEEHPYGYDIRDKHKPSLNENMLEESQKVLQEADRPWSGTIHGVAGEGRPPPSDYEKHMAQQKAQLRQARVNQLVQARADLLGRVRPSTGDWGKGLTPLEYGALRARRTKVAEPIAQALYDIRYGPEGPHKAVMEPRGKFDEPEVPPERVWYPTLGWDPVTGKEYIPAPAQFTSTTQMGREARRPKWDVRGGAPPPAIQQYMSPQSTAEAEAAAAAAHVGLAFTPIKGFPPIFRGIPGAARPIISRGRLIPPPPKFMRPDVPPGYIPRIPPELAPLQPSRIAPGPAREIPLGTIPPSPRVLSPEFAAQPRGSWSWGKKYEPLPEGASPELIAADDALQAKNLPRPNDDIILARAEQMMEKNWTRIEGPIIAKAETRLGKPMDQWTNAEAATVELPDRWLLPSEKDFWDVAQLELTKEIVRRTRFTPSARINILGEPTAPRVEVDRLTDVIAGQMAREAKIKNPASPYTRPEHFEIAARKEAIKQLKTRGREPSAVPAPKAPTAETSRMKRIWENSVGFITGRGVPKAEGGFRGWMRGRWVQKPWYKVPGQKGVKLQSPIPPGAIARGGVLLGGAAAIGEIKDWLAEYIGDSTDQEKLENRLVWMWDTEKEQWMDINREMVLDPKSGHIVGYWTGNKAVFGKEAHGTLLDYNGNSYQYSSLQPPAPPPQKCIDENIKSCLVVWGPANSRQEVAPEGLVEALWYYALHGSGTGTDIERFGIPAGHIRPDLLEKIKNEENLRGQFTLSPWAGGLRDIMRRPINKLGEPIGDPVPYGGPITNGLIDIDPETMGADYPYGPQSYMVDGSKCPTNKENPKYKECWAKVPKFLGRGRWEVLQNIPGIGRRLQGEEIEWVMHPYLASKMGATTKYPYIPAIIEGRPFFSTGWTKETLGDWFAPREGQSLDTIMKERFGEAKPIMLWRTDIPLAYQLDLFTDEELKPPAKAPNRIPIETEEDKINNNLIDLTVLYPGGYKDGDNAGEFLNSPFFENFRKDIIVRYIDQVREIQKNNPNTSVEKIIENYPLSDFVDAIRKKKEDKVDPQTGSLRLDTGGGPVDPERLVRDPNAPIGKQVKPAKPAWQERDYVTIKAMAKDYPEDGIMEFNVDPILLRTQTTKDGQKCWTKTDEGHYILASGECITDSLIGGGQRDPVAPGPAPPPAPGTKKELPSPEALRKAAPKRDDVEPSWIN